MKIHPTAIVDPQVELDSGVEVGPYAILEGEVRIGADCSIGSHAVVQGPLTMGAGNQVHPHAVLGRAPQDLKYRDERTRLEIGQGNTFREFVTVNRGTVHGGGCTRIGSGNLIMTYCHVGHDSRLGDGCILSNAVMLAGHVEIDDGASVGGLSGVHQFVRIGRQAFVGGCTALDRDVVPYGLAAGNRARLRHYNAVGLARRGLPAEALERIRAAFRVLLDPALSTAQAVARLERDGEGPEAREIVEFVRGTRRGVLRGRRRRTDGD